jgi:hypothetical protein
LKLENPAGEVILNDRLALYAIGCSRNWCAVVVLCAIILVLVSNPGAPFSIQSASIGGYLLLGALVSVIHGAVFWYSRRNPIRRRSAAAAIVASIFMLLLALITGFTLGIFLIPASGLLLLIGISRFLPSLS